jgi:cell division inhibitor SulA
MNNGGQSCAAADGPTASILTVLVQHDNKPLMRHQQLLAVQQSAFKLRWLFRVVAPKYSLSKSRLRKILSGMALKQ